MVKIFGGDKLTRTLKIVVMCFLCVLLLWFTFDITGLRFGGTILVVSAFKDEPIDFVFYIVFFGCAVFFVLKDNIGKYVLAVFLLLWGAFQFSVYFKSGDGIASYNEFFADTHHMIAASPDVLVKDTYHILLDIFISLAFISALAYIITQAVLHKRGDNGSRT